MFEQVLTILQDNTVFALAFCAWAWVVWHFGRKLTTEVATLSDRIRQMNYMLSNRLTKVEAHLEQGDRPFHPYRNGEA